MPERTTGPRRMLVTLAIGIGLVGSLGATECAANSPGTSAGSAKKKAKKATGSVVRCDSALSCDVTFRRGTTKRYVRWLRDQANPAVVATATTEAACLLLTHTLSAHVICALGSEMFLTRKISNVLKRAEASGDCLTIHIQAPAKKGTWRPISYGTDSGRDCAA